MISNYLLSDIRYIAMRMKPDIRLDSKKRWIPGVTLQAKNHFFCRSLSITWGIPDLNDEYRSSPGSYLGHLIG